MTTIDERLRMVFADAFETSPEAIDEGLTSESAAEWDSMRSIVLATSVEAEFGIEFSDTELMKLNSYRSIRDALVLKGVD